MANSFRDGCCRVWSVRFTPEAVRLIADTLGADPFLPGKQAPLALLEMMSRSEQLSVIVWVLIREQAEAAGITLDRFAAAVDPATVRRIFAALKSAALEYLPAKERAALRAYLDMAERRHAAILAGDKRR